MLLEVGNVFVTLSENVIDIFCRFRQVNDAQAEAGGIVLGQVSTDERRIFVNRASTPSRYDRRWPFGFQRNRHWAQQIVEYEHYNSGGCNTYLGEWHTHPAERAIPSYRDYKMIADQFANNDI
jgi:integrative and conjugative element protein (TIGR02256 family)